MPVYPITLCFFCTLLPKYTSREYELPDYQLSFPKLPNYQLPDFEILDYELRDSELHNYSFCPKIFVSRRFLRDEYAWGESSIKRFQSGKIPSKNNCIGSTSPSYAIIKGVFG
jgi:hypothetical protein